MNQNLSYKQEQQIKSLSNRIKVIANNNNTYLSYIDTIIKKENLQYNLSLILSHIIENLHFTERKKSDFLKIIKKYNSANNTKLTFEDFEKRLWVRIINKNVVIPILITDYIGQIKNKLIEPLEEIKDLIQCLLLYSDQYIKEKKHSITQKKIKTVLKKYAPKEISIEFLLEKTILKFNKEANNYYWEISNKYSRHLRNEIGSILWSCYGGKNITEEKSIAFFKCISDIDLFIDDFNIYFEKEDNIKIRDQIINILNSETDLIKSDNGLILSLIEI